MYDKEGLMSYIRGFLWHLRHFNTYSIWGYISTVVRSLKGVVYILRNTIPITKRRQGRSLQQVEDTEIIMGWTYTVGGIALLVGILASLISGSWSTVDLWIFIRNFVLWNIPLLLKRGVDLFKSFLYILYYWNKV